MTSDLWPSDTGPSADRDPFQAAEFVAVGIANTDKWVFTDGDGDPIQTYQHLLPGMQSDAARIYQRLAKPVPTAESDTVERRRNPRRNTAWKR